MKLILALASILLVPALLPAAPMSGGTVEAAPPGDEEVVAFIVRGVGNGHGRGMSQWGAYGRALAGQPWQQILDEYYGGTELGTRNDADIRVRLTEWDDAGTIGVVSRTGTARWNGSTTNFSSLYAKETAPNVFSVFGVTSGFGCPGQLGLVIPFVDLQVDSLGQPVVQLQQFLTYFGYDPGGVDGDFGPLTQGAVERFQADVDLTVDGLWRSEEATAAQAMVDAEPGVVDWGEPLASNVPGPIVFSTTEHQSNSGRGDGLGVCRQSGALIHYRGSIELRHESFGNRVVNELDVENYLRGVVPKEVSASWGDAGGGNGMNALRAQSVAARSFGLSQSRYGYAGTCDTSSCQVYGGSALRISPTTANYLGYEQANTDSAIADTAGAVRVWKGKNDIVSTEFSASNGPRTAGGSFPAVHDPFDDVPGNPKHRWTRVIDADSIISRYGLTSAGGVHTAPDADSIYEGIWANEVQLGQGKSLVSAWDFRNAFGLPSPGFELIPIRRMLTAAGDFAFIGDSVGEGIVDCCGANLKVLTEGVFASAKFDAVGGRPTQGGSNDGVHAAQQVPDGTDLVVVELGYNDSPSAMSARIDAVMTELRARNVGLVAWVNVSERKTSAGFATTNAAIDSAAARWDEMVVLDWQSASNHSAADRWFSDGIHLTPTGNAEFSLWLRDHIIAILTDGYTPPETPRPLAARVPLRVPVLGVGGVPESGVVGVALNVTAVNPSAAGWVRVWPCGSPEPETASVNYMFAGAVEPNAVVVPVDQTGEVCVLSMVSTDVVVDVSAWFDAGVRSATDRLVDTRETDDRLSAREVRRVPVLGVGGVPESGVVGVALNVTAVNPSAAGWVRVWPCGSPEPETASVNYMFAGAVEPNAVVVPVDQTGEVCVLSMVSTDVVVDVSAWFDAGVRSATDRLVDTRETDDRLSAREVRRVPVLGVGGVPESGVVGVALNVTAVNPSAAGWVRVWPCGSPEPETASVNYMFAGAVEPNAVVVPVDQTGEVCVLSMVSTDVVVDVSAWFDAGVRSATDRLVDTRYGVGPIPPR